METSKLQRQIIRVFDQLQKAQLQAGGRFISQEEFRKMTFEEILNLLIPNSVTFTIKCEKSCSRCGQENIDEYHICNTCLPTISL
jgi:hypothetical protein